MPAAILHPEVISKHRPLSSSTPRIFSRWPVSSIRPTRSIQTETKATNTRHLRSVQIAVIHTRAPRNSNNIMIHHNPALSGPYSTGSPRSTSIRVSEGFEVERSSPLSSQPRLPSVKRGLGSVDPLEVGLQTHLPPLLAAKARPFTVSGLIPFDPASLVVFFRSKVGRKPLERLKQLMLNESATSLHFFFLEHHHTFS